MNPLNSTETRTRLEQYQAMAHDLRDVLPASDIIVAGGALHDLLHGRDPKDVDLFWLGDGPIGLGEQVDEEVQVYASKIAALGGVESVEVYETYNKAGRLEFVITFERNGLRYDLICYGGMNTPREQVLMFDVNLNAVWLAQDEDGNPVIAIEPEAAEVLTGRKPIALMPQADKPLTRLQYMLEKYPQYKEARCAAN